MLVLVLDLLVWQLWWVLLVLLVLRLQVLLLVVVLIVLVVGVQHLLLLLLVLLAVLHVSVGRKVDGPSGEARVRVRHQWVLLVMHVLLLLVLLVVWVLRLVVVWCVRRRRCGRLVVRVAYRRRHDMLVLLVVLLVLVLVLVLVLRGVGPGVHARLRLLVWVRRGLAGRGCLWVHGPGRHHCGCLCDGALGLGNGQVPHQLRRLQRGQGGVAAGVRTASPRAQPLCEAPEAHGRGFREAGLSARRVSRTSSYRLQGNARPGRVRWGSRARHGKGRKRAGRGLGKGKTSSRLSRGGQANRNSCVCAHHAIIRILKRLRNPFVACATAPPNCCAIHRLSICTRQAAGARHSGRH